MKKLLLISLFSLITAPLFGADQNPRTELKRVQRLLIYTKRQHAATKAMHDQTKRLHEATVQMNRQSQQNLRQATFTTIYNRAQLTLLGARFRPFNQLFLAVGLVGFAGGMLAERHLNIK